MINLQYDRRDQHKLVLTDDSGNEYALTVNDDLQNEVRLIVQQQRGVAKIKPAQVQKLLRAGNTVQEVANITGYNSEDIERFAAPVNAELEFILQKAQSVPVRTGRQNTPEEEFFGAVIAQRLVTLAAENVTWQAYKEEKGWQISLRFNSYDTEYHAIWSFDHTKLLLTPETADATELSKQEHKPQGLIPKLRAVADASNKENSATTTTDTQTQDSQQTAVLEKDPASHAAAPADDAEHTANDTSSPQDLNETQDLLNALRRKRSEREAARQNTAHDFAHDLLNPPLWNPEEDVAADSVQAQAENHEAATDSQASQTDLFADEDVEWESLSARTDSANSEADTADTAQTARNDAESTANAQEPSKDNSKKRARQSIPSWDEILFGTRSEDDPA